MLLKYIFKLHLIKANDEASQKLLTSMKEKKARQMLNKAFAKYVEEPSRDNQQSLQNEKEQLKNCNQVIEDDLYSLFADVRSQHAESWRLINQISGRKTTKKCIIKGTSQNDCISNLFNQFLALNRSNWKVRQMSKFKLYSLISTSTPNLLQWTSTKKEKKS